MQIFAVQGRTGLADLRAQNHGDRVVVVPHRERDAEIANHRRDHVAGPGAVVAAVLRAPLQPEAAGVDSLLAKRAEALPRERLHAPAHFAAHEELLQPVVDRARETHAAQDLLALVVGERGRNGLALQPAIAGVEHVRARLFEPPDGRHAGRGLVERLAA